MVEKVFKNVLLISKESSLIRAVLESLAGRGIRGTVVSDHGGINDGLSSREWEMVLVDLDMVNGQFARLLENIRGNYPELPVIACGKNDTQLAVSAIKRGCANFMAKPADSASVAAILDAVLPQHEVAMAASAEDGDRCVYEIAGRSQTFLDALDLGRKIAPTSIPVLITGESGTGKELVSYFVHRCSNRNDKPYIRVNCAAISESLLESELFGHERGAFTGAYMQRKGRFERAHGGTLLLDEISETGPKLQAQLLRVLEQQDFERVGGNELIRVNVRVISTSNRNLLREVEAGRFRRDLYHRLCGVHLIAPPLRERLDDLEVLTWYFVNKHAGEVNRTITTLDPDMLEQFRQFDWPGNVRQLRNVVRSLLILGEGPTLSMADSRILESEPRESSATTLSATVEAPTPVIREMPRLAAAVSAKPQTPIAPPSMLLKDMERKAIIEAMRQTGGNQTKAAKMLGITDRTLREKLRKYRQEGGEYQPVGEGTWEKSLA